MIPAKPWEIVPYCSCGSCLWYVYVRTSTSTYQGRTCTRPAQHRALPYQDGQNYAFGSTTHGASTTVVACIRFGLLSRMLSMLGLRRYSSSGTQISGHNGGPTTIMYQVQLSQIVITTLIMRIIRKFPELSRRSVIDHLVPDVTRQDIASWILLCMYVLCDTCCCRLLIPVHSKAPNIALWHERNASREFTQINTCVSHAKGASHFSTRRV